jgi:hypothetical protein
VSEDNKLPEPQNQHQKLRCPTCNALPRVAHHITDPCTGNKFRLYRCECGESVWEE